MRLLRTLGFDPRELLAWQPQHHEGPTLRYGTTAGSDPEVGKLSEQTWGVSGSAVTAGPGVRLAWSVSGHEAVPELEHLEDAVVFDQDPDSDGIRPKIETHPLVEVLPQFFDLGGTEPKAVARGDVAIRVDEEAGLRRDGNQSLIQNIVHYGDVCALWGGSPRVRAFSGVEAGEIEGDLAVSEVAHEAEPDTIGKSGRSGGTP